jgi:hypothetical protein
MAVDALERSAKHLGEQLDYYRPLILAQNSSFAVRKPFDFSPNLSKSTPIVPKTPSPQPPRAPLRPALTPQRQASPRASLSVVLWTSIPPTLLS